MKEVPQGQEASTMAVGREVSRTTITWEPALQTFGFWAQPQACLTRSSELGTKSSRRCLIMPYILRLAGSQSSGEPESLGERLKLARPGPTPQKLNVNLRGDGPGAHTHLRECILKAPKVMW